MVFSLRKTWGNRKMGLSYDPKPDFIERLIEDAAYRFFKAFSAFTKAGAITEVSEAVGFPKKAIELLEESQWNLGRALEIYDSLFTSIENLPVEQSAMRGLRGFDFKAMLQTMSTQGTVTVADRVFAEFQASVSSGIPVNVIRAYARRMEKTRRSLEGFKDNLTAGDLNPISGHVCLTNFIETTIYGQYVATLNRMARENLPARQEKALSPEHRAKLDEVFAVLSDDPKASESDSSSSSHMTADDFCGSWPTAREALAFLASLPGIPSLVKDALLLGIRTGDSVSDVIC